MSKFKVGDRVRCIKASSGTDAGAECVVWVVDTDETIKVEGNHMWHMDYNFELITPPQPESPDDWVIQDQVPARRGIDEWRWLPSGGVWYPSEERLTRRHGNVVDGYTFEVRCRRRDYPQQPTEVHTGGPYVAQSVYRDLVQQYDKSLQQYLEDQTEIMLLQRELANEKASSGQVILELREDITAMNDLLRTREKAATVQQAETIKYAEECEKLQQELNNAAAQRDHLFEVCDKMQNGWPLVPVDPACIPDGHRAVEVTAETIGRCIVSRSGSPHWSSMRSRDPRLVVEPIPAEQPAQSPLPRPEFPAWIRAGWWVAMDSDGDWYGYKEEPTILHSEDQWVSPRPFKIMDDQKTPSMKSISSNRWREAKWQVE